MDEQTIRGAATAVDLGNVAPLLLPWAADPYGQLRPPLSLEALRLSAEISSATYTMDVDPWMRSGWRDVTLQVDGELSDLASEGSWLQNRWRLHRARAKMRQRNPVSQVMGAIRQKEKSDTGKAVVMIHPAKDGRYVVAISFMGTGERFYDWFSNFRMSSEGGLHKGFVQLARQFEDNEEDIIFPETAKELGLEKLNLRQIVQEARHPGSRFILWLSGHSQGAAMMQVYALLKTWEDGVLPRNMLGYGFASPSVATGLAVDEPAALPLYHVLNSDDLVPRMGAMVHLGLCLTYPADEALRRSCYELPQTAEAISRRRAVAPLIQRMTDTPRCMEIAAGFLMTLSDCTEEELMEALSALDIRFPLRRVLRAADSRVDRLMRAMIRRLEAAYRSVTGMPMDRGRVAQAADDIVEAVGKIGLRSFLDTTLLLMGLPHGIRLRQGKPEPYLYIVMEGIDRLYPWVWVSGQNPRRKMATAGALSGYTGSELWCRRREKPRQRQMRRVKGVTPRLRQDTRHHAQLLQPDGARAGEHIIRQDGK